MMGLGSILERKQPQTRSTEVLLDPGLVQRRDELLLSIKRAEARHEAMGDSDWRSPVAQWRAELEEVEAAIREATIVFTFAALPRVEWNSLVEQHLEDGSDELTDEFMVEVVFRSLVDPAPENRGEVERIFQEWSATETDRLYLTAFAANRESRSIPFTEAGIDLTSSTGSSSTTAESEVSRTASS